jgi:HK97 family phage major capsid protein
MNGNETPEAAVEAALTGLAADLAGIRAEMKTQLKQQDERLTMLNAKTISLGRPALAGAAAVEAPHQKAFAAYVRHGEDEALRGLSLEGKALSTAVAGDGGYLVDPQTTDRIATVLRANASLRRIARIVNVESNAFEALIDSTDIGAGWATETAATTETSTPTIERIVIPLHELAAMPKASQRLLDDSAFDVEGWLAERIADKFVRAEAAAFVSGNGIDKPKGFLAHTAVTNASWAWGSLGYVPTGTAGGFGSSADSLVDLVYALGARYRANGTFAMNSKTAGAVRKMKDAEGRFLWADGLGAGEPARLMGYPVLIAEDMPDIAANSYSVAFGDFGSGYTVVERPDLRILRDPFSSKPHVVFYATKRVGGDVTDFAAIKLLKFAVS